MNAHIAHAGAPSRLAGSSIPVVRTAGDVQQSRQKAARASESTQAAKSNETPPTPTRRKLFTKTVTQRVQNRRAAALKRNKLI